MNSSSSIKESFGGIVLGFVEGTVLFLIGLITLFHTDSSDRFSVAMCVLLMLLGISLFFVFFFLYAVESREFSMDTNGFTLRYLKRFYKYYGWAEVSSITVCDINHASKDASKYELVIRIVIGDEKNGPYSKTKNWAILSGYERWRTSEYGIRHFRNVIPLTYTPERFLATQMFSKKNIGDKRTLRAAKDRSF